MTASDPIRAIAAMRAVSARRAEHRPTTPAELAARLIPNYTVTPTLRLLSDVLADAITGAERRIIISTPPRTGKSVLVSQIGPVFALMHNPDAQIVVKSYGDVLAEEHSRGSRRFINENHELLGIDIISVAQRHCDLFAARGPVIKPLLRRAAAARASQIARQPAPELPSARWCPDPSGSRSWRWWNGTGWT